MKIRALFLSVFAVLLSLGNRSALATVGPPAHFLSGENPAAAGPVGYRCFIRVPAKLVTPQEKDLWRDSMTLNLGGIHGPFAVYLNGQKIIESPEAPDGARQRFKLPKGILQKDVFNILAIRLDPKAAGAGIGQA